MCFVLLMRRLILQLSDASWCNNTSPQNLRAARHSINANQKAPVVWKNENMLRALVWIAEHAAGKKWHTAQWDRNRKGQRVGKGEKFPVLRPKSYWTCSVLSGPWKVWLSDDFPEPGKFPQWRSAAPLSARIAGPLRETQSRLCQIPCRSGRRRWGRIGV